MTIAIGIVNAAGAVLLTDSLVQMRAATGFRALLCLTPRLEALPGARGSALVFCFALGS